MKNLKGKKEMKLRDVVDEVNAGVDFSIAYRNFLDVFYLMNDTEKEKSLADEPCESVNLKENQYAFLASMAHKLSHDFKLTPPEWIFEDKYYLEHMDFWGVGKSRLRFYNMLYSPIEFKTRNLLVDENILERV